MNHLSRELRKGLFMFAWEKIPEFHGTRQGESYFLLIFAYICVIKKEVPAE